MNFPIAWLVAVLSCIMIQAFHSMMEMASFSLSKIKLAYYADKGYSQAIHLLFLLEKPSRLFGTVMLGTNIALQVGSQCSRELYTALGLNPDYSALTQVFVVVIFGELVPVLLARNYPERIIKIGMPVLYCLYKITSPIVWVFEVISELIPKLFNKPNKTHHKFYYREELQDLIEKRIKGYELDAVIGRVFSLDNKTTEDLMIPLHKLKKISEDVPANSASELIENIHTQDWFPIYRKLSSNIIGLISNDTLLSISDERPISNFVRLPWFILSSEKLINIIFQFQRHNEPVAIVLNSEGKAKGILSLQHIMQEIFMFSD